MIIKYIKKLEIEFRKLLNISRVEGEELDAQTPIDDLLKLLLN